jgi:hypothetical protein
MSALLETRLQRVSLAVRLMDDLTGRPARGPISVTLQGRAGLPVANAGGYFVFSDLPTGTVQVRVRADAYLPEAFDVTLPLPNPREPVREVTLRPSRLYGFPSGSTLLRGVVRDAAGGPVAGASVQGVGRDTRTGEDGRFVAYFRGLTEDDVTVVDGRRLVKAPDGTTGFDLSVSRSGFTPRLVEVSDLEEGATRVLAAPIVLVAV